MASAAAMSGQETAHYTRVAVWLHWIIAALIVANLAIGWFSEDLSKPVRGALMSFHKATGITILALTLARLGWRLAHRPPAFDAAMKPWEAKLARATHVLFYVLLLALPLSGWLMVSSGTRPIGWYGLFEVPKLPVAKSSHELFETSHALLGYGMAILLILHVGGALKHHFDGHRHLIGRMAPWARRG